MGREAFLTRLSLGRSAYEPPEPAVRSSEAPGRDEADQDAASHTGRAAPQEDGAGQRRYDDRGRPVNPDSRALGRELRAAQNDVLAAVGVVERNKVKKSWRTAHPSQRRDARIVELVKAEEFCGTLVAIFGTLLRYFGVWWVKALLDRIMTYRYPDDMSFVELVSRQYRAVGPATFFFAGLPAQLMSMIANDGDHWASLLIACLNEALYRTKASRKTVRRVQRWKPWIRRVISWSIELAFAPLLVLAASQRLLIIPASQTMPPLKSFNPFSAASPIRFGPSPGPWNRRHLLDHVLNLLFSPAVLVTAWRQAMVRLQQIMYEPLEKGVLAPDNPDMYTSDEASERRKARKSRTKCKQDLAQYRWARRFLASLGWSRQVEEGPSAIFPRDSQAESRSGGMAGAVEGSEAAPSEVAAGASTGGGSGGGIGQTGQAAPVDSSRPVESRTDGGRSRRRRGDATVRIASRDEESGVVSLEIRLPEEMQQEAGASGNGADMEQGGDEGAARTRLHRVTQLTGEPAEMLGSMVNYTFSELVLLPVKAVGLRYMAISMLSGWCRRNGRLAFPAALARSSPRVAVLMPWQGAASWLRRRNGVYVERVALCCGLEMVVGLGIWGVECVAVTALGRRYFGWM